MNMSPDDFFQRLYAQSSPVESPQCRLSAETLSKFLPGAALRLCSVTCTAMIIIPELLIKKKKKATQ